MAEIVRETEHKYEALPETLAALAGLPGTVLDPARRETLDAVYYDTEDLRLLRARVTLRWRIGGGDAGWHLKLPAGRDTRDEVRLPLAEPESGEAGLAGPVPGVPEGVPDELVSLTAAHARGRPLVPVARLRTARKAQRLTSLTGRPLAEVVSDSVTARTLAGEPASADWDELEVELIGGDATVLEAIDRALRAQGARDAGSPSKLARLLGDRLLPPGDRSAPPGGGEAAARAGEVVLGYLRTQVRAVIACDPRVRLDRADAVHQMRVATRRTRSALQVYAAIIDRERTREVAAELKWLAAALGAARDREVLLERLLRRLDEVEGDLVHGPVRARVTQHLTEGLEEARLAAVAELNGSRYLALLDVLDALIADPPFTREAGRAADRVLPPLLHQAQRRLERALRRIDRASDRDTAMHEARKAAKRARYAAEIAEPVLGRAAKRQVARAKRLQEVLGDHQDGVVSRAVLLEIAARAHGYGEETFTYGLLHEREASAARDLERLFGDGVNWRSQVDVQ
ncbi:CYTH and CHAD domain-containing protein [Actinomadura macra]|uniref:CYTH and CHAD domain-containing protein n=1 Tax=Actinomadura macra TaxID=46164 RepID=UPI0008308612|nr:CYTH and CHAD domain-containing protein [Actinomadura macra]